MKIIRIIIHHTLLILCIFFALPAKVLKKRKKPVLVWGTDPIINIKYWSSFLKLRGYQSTTLVTNCYSINKHDDFDIILNLRARFIPETLKRYFYFLKSIYQYDIFHVSFNGFLLGKTFTAYLEPLFFKIFNKKVVVIPYGSDLYIYSRVQDISLRHALLKSYPNAAINEDMIIAQVDRWNKYADHIIGTAMIDVMTRWDSLYANPLCIDTKHWKPLANKSLNNEFVITHTPNHKGFKGSEFIKTTIQNLKAKGFSIRYQEIQNAPNEEIRNILQCSDLLIEQVVANCYGLSAIEGMSVGIPVISNLEDSSLIRTLRRYSFYKECPIYSCSIENLEDRLQILIEDKELQSRLSKDSRNYVLKYHDGKLFTDHLESIYENLW